jgi:hypothetical protein
MKHTPTAAVVALIGAVSLACGGGPREAGIDKKEHDRTLVFVPYDEFQSPDEETCGDLDEINFEFPLILAEYFALAVDAEGTSIEVSWCDEETKCGPSDPEVTLDVNGTEYAGGTVAQIPFNGWEGCDAIDVDLQWRIDDGGEIIDVEQELLISIPDDGACSALEASVQAASENGRGLDGCVIASGFTADYLKRCKFGSNSYSCVGNSSDDD